MRRSTLILGFALVCGLTYAARDMVPAAGAASDTLESWDKKHKKNLEKAAKRWITLQKWCDRKQVEWTGLYVRRRALTYLPDDKETRTLLGYDPAPGGGWIRNELRRDEIKAGVVDVDDPAQLDIPKKIVKETKTCVKYFRSAARKAAKMAQEDPDNAAAWREREKLGWQWVLKADMGNQEARQALGHPQFDGKYVSPFALPYLEARKARKAAAEKINAMTFETKDIEPAGLFVAAGLSGAAVQSEHVTMQAVQGKELVNGMCQSAEKALIDLIETHGFSENVKGRNSPKKITAVKEEDEYIRFLMAAKWDKAKAKQHLERYRGGTSVGAGERMGVAEGAQDANDRAMNVTASFTLRGYLMSEAVRDVEGANRREPEDWLWQSISYDMTRRILGTALLVWAGDPRYGRKFIPRPGQDEWIGKARRNVEVDDDPPFSYFPGLEINEQEFKAEHTVKGYAVINYVYEKDPVEAQRFIRNAMAKGTLEAVKTVYGWTMDEFDQHYHEWILRTHEP